MRSAAPGPAPMKCTVMTRLLAHLRRRSWLDPYPLRHRHCRAPAGFPADGVGAQNRDTSEFTAESGVTGEQERLGFERHSIDHEAAAAPQGPRRGIERARIAGAAANEDG